MKAVGRDWTWPTHWERIRLRFHSEIFWLLNSLTIHISCEGKLLQAPLWWGRRVSHFPWCNNFWSHPKYNRTCKHSAEVLQVRSGVTGRSFRGSTQLSPVTRQTLQPLLYPDFILQLQWPHLMLKTADPERRKVFSVVFILLHLLKYLYSVVGRKQFYRKIISQRSCPVLALMCISTECLMYTVFILVINSCNVML